MYIGNYSYFLLPLLNEKGTKRLVFDAAQEAQPPILLPKVLKLSMN